MTPSKEISSGILRAVAILFGLVVLGWFLYKIQSVLVYLALAIVTTLVGRPVVSFLRRRLKFGNTAASLITIILMLAFLLGILGLFIPLIKQQSHNLSLLNLESITLTAESLYREFIFYFSDTSIDIEKELKDSGLLKNFNFGIIPDFINGFLSFLGSFSLGLFAVLFISFFLLKDSRLLEQSILSFIPENRTNIVSGSLMKIKNLLSRYFIGIIFQMVILFVIYSVTLLIFGIDNAIVIAFLCALLNIIPYLGPIISGFLMFFLAMSSNLGEDFSSVILPTSLYVMIGFAIGQTVDNLFSQPFIYSSSVKSHPLEIFLVIIISGLLFGIVGMIAAVPAYTVIKVIAKQFLSDIKVVKNLTEDI